MEKELPNNWVEGNLYELVQPVKTGVSKYEGQKPYYSTGSVKEDKLTIEGKYSFDKKPSRANRQGNEGDVLQARMRHTDKALIINKELKNGLFSTGFMQFRPYGKTILPKYLYYYLKSEDFHSQKDELASGTTQVAINDTNARKIVFPVSPLNEQRRIVEKLDYLFKELEYLNSKLENIPKKIDDLKKSIINKGVSGAFLNNKNNVKWKQVKSSKLFQLVTSGSRGWAKYYDNDGEQLFVRITNMNYGTLNLELSENKLQFLSLPEASEGKRTLLKPRDILISITADVGMVSLIPEDWEYESYVNQHVCLARPIKEVNAEYLCYYFMSDFGFLQLESKKRGATKAGLTLGDIKSLNIKIPELKIQELIVNQIRQYLHLIDSINHNYGNLKYKINELPLSILRKAFKGDLVEQLPSDGDARELLEEIKELNKETNKVTKRAPKKKPEKKTSDTSIKKTKTGKSKFVFKDLSGTASYNLLEHLKNEFGKKKFTFSEIDFPAGFDYDEFRLALFKLLDRDTEDLDDNSIEMSLSKGQLYFKVV